METSSEKTERAAIKLILGSAGAFVLFILVCWAGFHFYEKWEERHLIRRASAVLSGGDWKAASLNARRVVQLNPKNADASRLLAQISEKAGDRSELDWRRKVLELQPGSLDDALALIRCALRFNDVSTAQKTLDAMDEGARRKPEFYAASGRVAETKKDFAAAEKFWAKAAEIAPADLGYQFQLALVRLNSTDRVTRDAALAVLEKLRSEPSQRTVATRSLILDGVAHGADSQRIRSLAEELQKFPDASFSDKIVYLEILRQLHDLAYQDYLKQLQSEVLRSSAADLASLLSWMIRNGMSREAIELVKSVPAETATKWPVPFAIAEAHAQAKNWNELERMLKGSEWGNFDFLRRACLSRALRAQDKTLAAEQELNAAQKEASANPQTLSMLTQTIAEWGWRSETVELLWVLAKHSETRLQALASLYENYSKTEDTAGLYRTLTKFAEIKPDDPVVRNNLAQVSLLLGVDVDHARKVAAELSAKEPSNAAYLSTYAFSLLSRGDVKAAVTAMDRLGPEQLREPAVATYYGIILAAAGQKDKAREFLRRSSEAHLLPEEKALTAKAENSLN